ncbi:Putative DNA-binding domain-containing protein [Cohaesibacter sp. ES.047]|uniref:HvfC/BufC N-terminal domain-containing protein n=1 Tax=Cohaesibacter sp. ES.047 TaxID=1798205 RepID=UPI000BB92F04|nr:DNA-binding domain-containing protein [Cohaesibacter sp. ES.047]SNY91582.1 Putative DNA-binding domain-containing protein [Cohaesibacter sp. ES.047]
MPSDQTSLAHSHALTIQQKAFSDALLAPDLPIPSGVIGPSRMKKAQKRFGIYRNNVVSSLTEALAAAFPTIHQLVGDDFFRAMARVYITTHPPRSPMLASYGATFGDFLDGFEPVGQLPYLGDVARLEHAWLRSYNAADAPSLDPAELQRIDPEQLGALIFDLHPSAELLSSSHPAYSIWAAHKSDDPASAIANVASIPEDTLITRPEWDVMVVSLPAGGHDFIHALMTGHPLGEAAERAANNNEAFDFALNLGGLLETGAIASIHPPGS